MVLAGECLQKQETGDIVSWNGLRLFRMEARMLG